MQKPTRNSGIPSEGQPSAQLAERFRLHPDGMRRTFTIDGKEYEAVPVDVLSVLSGVSHRQVLQILAAMRIMALYVNEDAGNPALSLITAPAVPAARSGTVKRRHDTQTAVQAIWEDAWRRVDKGIAGGDNILDTLDILNRK